VGVTGTISLDADRNAVKPAVVLKLQDKRYIYQETIYPEGMTAPAAPATSSTSPAAATESSPVTSPSAKTQKAAPSSAASPASGTEKAASPSPK